MVTGHGISVRIQYEANVPTTRGIIIHMEQVLLRPTGSTRMINVENPVVSRVRHPEQDPR
jgi:hypothetical protein